ncbi:MAG: ABC transporter permease [Arenicellales bacterium]|jgi:simple sugar transport system permease protein|nr:ABC transporter permease [Arenicellales bacterium]|tara:strand:- start:1514 stop:2563 length:1050 start_codon:yes stop_codon:yes gene_type:complete
MRLERRQGVGLWLRLVLPAIAVVIALSLCATLLVWAGVSVSDAYFALARGAFGSKFALTETLTRATPLIFTGLAAAVAFRAKLWNIGGEGQLYVGAMAITLFGTGAVSLPPVLMIPFLFVVAILAGGLLLLFSALLKTWLRVDEVVTTLLLNFVVLLLVDYLLFGPWKDPMALGWPQAARIIDEGRLLSIVPRSRLHLGLVFAVGAACLVWLTMRSTRWGFEIRAVGHNILAAGFSGIPVKMAVIRTALLSGGLAACAGVTEVAGTKGYLTVDISPGFGYTGIAVAMLAGLNPLGVIAAAIFFAGIYNGADSMSRAMNVSNYIADVITATAMLSMLVCSLLINYRLKRD